MECTDQSLYGGSEVTAREVVAILRRRRWTVLLMAALFVLLGAVMTSRMTPVYRSSATMIIETSPTRTSHPENEGPLSPLMQESRPHSLETQVEVLQSGPLQEKVIEKISPIPAGAYPSLMVAQRSTTDIIEVIAESTSPKVACAAANALVDEYIEQSEETNLRTVRQTRKFVEERLRVAEPRLARADVQLRDYKSRYGLPDLTSNLSTALAATAGVAEELRRGENELSKLRGQIQQIRTQIAREPRLVQASSTTVPNPEVNRLRSQIENLKLQRITLLRTLRPTEPEVRDVDTQIRLLDGTLEKLPRTVRSGLTVQPNPVRAALISQLDGFMVQERGLRPQVVRLREQHREAQAQLRSFPLREAQLTQLQRERSAAEENVKTLRSQLWTLRMREQAQGVSARPLDRAWLPGSPVRPNRSMNLLVAAVLGIVFGVGAACLREMLDDRLHTADDVERLTELRSLGRIPVLPRRAGQLVAIGEESPVKESFRRLRAGIIFAANGQSVSSVMVTSATAGEGKSTTAANLAIAVAMQGRNVILVDADMRNPSLGHMFGVAEGPGLGDVLVDAVPLNMALHSTSIEHLLLMPAGTRLANAAELLSDGRMPELVKKLKEMADLVILDTPPCVPVADAEIIGSQADAALLVVALGRAQKEAVRMARDLLEQAHVRLLGTVLNRANPSDMGRYYRYRYRTWSDGSRSSLPVAQSTVLPMASAHEDSASSAPEERTG